ITATINKGESINVFDTYINNKNELWYNVKLSDGKFGWVLSLETQTSPIVNPNTTEVVYAAETLHVRRGALTSYAITATIKKGELINVVDTFINNKNELWYNVKLSDGKFG